MLIYSLLKMLHLPNVSKYCLFQIVKWSWVPDICKTFRDPQKNYRKTNYYLLPHNSELILIQTPCSLYKAFFLLFLNKAEAILKRLFSVSDLSTQRMFLKFLFFFFPSNLLAWQASLCTAFNYIFFSRAKWDQKDIFLKGFHENTDDQFTVVYWLNK